MIYTELHFLDDEGSLAVMLLESLLNWDYNEAAKNNPSPANRLDAAAK